MDDGFYVLVGHVEQNFWEVCFLLADLQEQLLEGFEGAVDDCQFDGLAVERQEAQSWVGSKLPVTAPMERPHRENLASGLKCDLM